MPRLGLLFFLLYLSGCATQSPVERAQPARILPQPLVALAPPLGPPRRIVQRLTAHWPDNDQTLLCVIELDSHRIAMVGLTQVGMMLFSLSYDGKQMEYEQNPLVKDTVTPELTLSDLQLAYWPLDVLRARLRPSMVLDASQGARRLLENGRLQVEIRFNSSDSQWPSKLELINFRYHYRLEIDTVSYEVLSE